MLCYWRPCVCVAQQRGRLARVTQNSHQSLEFRKWAKVVHSLSHSRQGLSAIQKCVRACLCVWMVWILYSEPIMSIDEHKQTVDIKIEFLLVLPLVDAMLSTHTATPTLLILLFFAAAAASSSLALLHQSLALAPSMVYYAIKSTRVWSFTFSTSPPYGPLFDLRLIIAQTLFTHRFSWWEWNLSESN